MSLAAPRGGRERIPSKNSACQVPQQRTSNVKAHDVIAADPEAKEYVLELGREFPPQTEIPQAEHRCITLRQLLRVAAFAARYATSEVAQKQWYDPGQDGVQRRLTMEVLNFYHLAFWLIRPATKGNIQHTEGCAFTELLASGPQEPGWFVSHWWGEKFVDFIKCVEVHSGERDRVTDAGYWVGAFALKLHSSKEIELSEDLSHSPFYRALQCSEGQLVVVNSKTEFAASATYFMRIWCVLEMIEALEEAERRSARAGKQSQFFMDIATCQGLEAQLLTEGLTPSERMVEEKKRGDGYAQKTEREAAFPIAVLDSGFRFRLQEAQATREADRMRILEHLVASVRRRLRGTGGAPSAAAQEEEHLIWRRVNKSLRASLAMAVWRQAVEKNAVDTLRLPSIVYADQDRTKLVVDMRFTDVNNTGAWYIAKGISAGLRVLKLKFTDCDQLDDRALATLASRLPECLLQLSLNFDLCDRIGDSGVAALAQSLPDALQTLSLSFASCTELGDHGLAALAQGLPMGLQQADIRLKECSRISDIGLAAFARTNAVVLRRLSLDCHKCEHVTSAGLAALARGGSDEKTESFPMAGANKPENAAKTSTRKLILHFALPRTLMTCDMAAHRTTEEELNSVLSEMAWGRCDQNGAAWFLVAKEPTLDPPDPTFISYGDYLRKIYGTDLAKAEHKQGIFTHDSEPGKQFQSFLEKMVNNLSFLNNRQLSKAYDVKRVVMREDEAPENLSEPEQAIMRFGRHQVLPAFWNLLIQLTKLERNFSLVLRAWTPKQLAVVQRELQFFCKGLHPAYSGQNKTKMPPRMNGEKGSRDYRLQAANIGRVFRAHGLLKFLQVEDQSVIHGKFASEDMSSNPGADEEDKAEEPDDTVEGVEPMVYEFPPFHEAYNGLVHNVLGRAATAAIVDDYAYWEAHGKKASAGKLHIVDHNNCLADETAQHIFFDGSIRAGNAHCVDVRDLNSGDVLSLSEIEGLFVHRVDFFQACNDTEYFVKALEACEHKMMQRATRTNGGDGAGSCFPLSTLELNFGECADVGDGGLAALAEFLPRTLQELTLNLGCCFRLGDPGLAALAEGLPDGLRVLRLGLRRCPKLGTDGIAALVEKLPMSLLSLSLDLQRCYGIKDQTVQLLKMGLPSGLEHLDLDIQFTDVGDSRKKQCRTLKDLQESNFSSIDTVYACPAMPAKPAEPEDKVAAPAKPAEASHGSATMVVESQCPSEPKPRWRQVKRFVQASALVSRRGSGGADFLSPPVFSSEPGVEDATPREIARTFDGSDSVGEVISEQYQELRQKSRTSLTDAVLGGVLPGHMLQQAESLAAEVAFASKIEKVADIGREQTQAAPSANLWHSTSSPPRRIDLRRVRPIGLPLQPGRLTGGAQTTVHSLPNLQVGGQRPAVASPQQPVLVTPRPPQQAPSPAAAAHHMPLQMSQMKLPERSNIPPLKMPQAKAKLGIGQRCERSHLGLAGTNTLQPGFLSHRAAAKKYPAAADKLPLSARTSYDFHNVSKANSMLPE